MLSYKITIKHDEQLIYVDVEGKFDSVSYKSISEEVVSLYNEYKYNVFYDLYSTILDFDVEELDSVSRDVEGKDTLTAHQIYIAGYVNKQDCHNWKFVEFMNRAMGYHTRAFLDKHEALQWLSDHRQFM